MTEVRNAMGLCVSTEKQLRTKQSRASFKKADTSGDGRLETDELAKYIERHGELWMMLAANLSISDDRCKELAVDTAFEIAGEERNGMKSMNINQFIKFRDIVAEPKGQLEFFHRTVFSAFDLDKNGWLDDAELGKFLDTFYETGSIFKDDARLPPKEQLMQHLKSSSEHGKINFDVLHSLISGKTKMSSATSQDVEVAVKN